MRTPRRLLPALVLALALTGSVSTTGCAKSSTASLPGTVNRSPLEVTAKAVADIAGSVNTITSTVITANAQGLINDVDTRAILNICQNIALADSQASALIRNLSTLTPAQQGNVWAVLKPVVATVNSSLTNGLLGIKNPETKQKTQLALVTLQAALAAVQIAIGGN